jgi:hypothetical protein
MDLTMAKKRRKYSQRSSMDKSLNKTLKGFFMRWSSVDPLGDHDQPTTVSIGHLNPVMSIRLRNDLFWESLRQVLHVRKCKWRMEIRMEFTKKNGDPEFKRYEIVGVDRLPNLDDKYQETVELMLADAVEKNYLDRYVTTHVQQEIIDGQEIKDCDFT